MGIIVLPRKRDVKKKKKRGTHSGSPHFSFFCLQRADHRILHDQVFHMPEAGRTGMLPIIFQPRFIGIKFIPFLLDEMAVVEIDILYRAILPADNGGGMHGEGMDIAEIQIADGAAQAMIINEDIDGLMIQPVDGAIGEIQVFNVGGLIPLIAVAMGRGIAGQADINAHCGIGDIQIGEGAVADHAVIGPGNADGAGMAGQIAVGHADLFAYRML